MLAEAIYKATLMLEKSIIILLKKVADKLEEIFNKERTAFEEKMGKPWLICEIWYDD
jgi:hypothetical protein